MKGQILQPQEVEAFYIIPAVRREMAISMKAAGKKQKDIAELLSVRESTISQYISDKRAASISFDDHIKKDIAKAAKKIRDRLTMVTEMQRILNQIRQDRAICDIHMQISGEMPKNCDVCFVK